MASEVTICNLSLSHLGLDSIESFQEKSKAAQECKRLYEFVRDETLRDHDWSCARVQKRLALLAETRTGWSFVYRYPLDCLAARAIYDPTGAQSVENPETGLINPYGNIPYEIAASEDLSKRVILTNQEEAQLIYTAKVIDANIYDASLIAAFALHLAAYLAIPLKRDKALKQSLANDYRLRLSQAQTSNANEGSKPPDNSSSFSRARQ